MKKNICFLIDHPFDLVLFLGLRNILIEKFEIYTIALFTNHNYFAKCSECKNLIEEFDKVNYINRPSYSKNIVKNVSKTIGFIKIIKDVINEYNPLFFSANRSELTTKIIEKYAGDRLHRILQRSTVDTQRLANDYVLNLKLTALRRFYEIIFGLETTTAYNNKKSKNLWYFKHNNEDMSRTFYLVNRNEIPKVDEIHFPYYFVQSKNHDIIKRVYFFGNRFLGWDFLDAKVAIKTINHILRKIEETYPNHILIYKAHPLENDEVKYLELGKFIVDAYPNSAEIEYIKYYSDIEAVYSIGSTSSKTAFNFGLQSYLTYKLFKFDKEVERKFDDLFINLPSDMFLYSCEDIQNIPSPKNFSSLSIDNLLGKIL